jgi:hypothetical protein
MAAISLSDMIRAPSVAGVSVALIAFIGTASFS